ncbi:hypothetical protein FNV43_RR27084 [Rhamnella rubrinervis]|uniref:Bidirectional sugar transporter SWEET n=1 Tax=Rhamnella rubrinervis TaxID=2594499 RepID=A0A8K0DQD0_9ROSA|nr:hypothetical protein FNV43_RR27084 [Rhamnella rubrinervis]
MVYLAPVTTFYRVYRKKSTEGFHSVPYLVALFSAMLWFYYALVKKDAMLLITINCFGCFIEIVYISMYIAYAPREARNLTFKLFGLMNLGTFSLILLLTQMAVRDQYRVQVLGWICVAVSVSVFAAPLSILAQVIKTRSVEFMPFTLSCFLTLSAVMWFGYGLLLKDICIALPNVLGFALGLIQMILYAIYKNCNKVVMEEKKLPEHELKNIVIVSTIATSEVHPVELQPASDKVDHKDEHGEDDDADQEKIMEGLEGLKPNDESPV